MRAALLLFSFSFFLSFAAPSAYAAGSPLKALQRKSPGQSPGKSARKSEIVVAEVNGRKITLAEVEEHLRGLPPEVGIQALKNAKRFLEEFVQTELLFQEAVRRKVDILPEVQSRIRMSRRQILIKELVKRLVRRSERILEEELRRFYRDNRDRFARKASVRLSHIVLKTKQDASDALAELRRGVPFEEVSRKRSIIEASRESGGVLGIVRRGEIDRNIEKAAFSLPIGQFSRPIKTPVGWQIIRVTERTPAAEARFEEVKDDVRKILFQIRRQEKYRFLLERLRSENKVTIYPERFR